jgi:hypothetical protein
VKACRGWIGYLHKGHKRRINQIRQDKVSEYQMTVHSRRKIDGKKQRGEKYTAQKEQNSLHVLEGAGHLRRKERDDGIEIGGMQAVLARDTEKSRLKKNTRTSLKGRIALPN